MKPQIHISLRLNALEDLLKDLAFIFMVRNHPFSGANSLLVSGRVINYLVKNQLESNPIGSVELVYLPINLP